ncbi:MAG: hypothetical protein AAF633_07865 [Chloroflexota bacterium]
MDILHLIDRLEQLLTESRRIPMTASIIVDEDRIFNIIDQMRVSIPDEIRKAGRVFAEKERVIAQAKEEADRVRQLARKEAEEMVSRDTVTRMAHERSEKIEARARHEASCLREDADIYVMNQLSKLEDDLLNTLTIVRNGLRKIQSDHGFESPAPEPVQNDSQEEGE